MSKIGSDLVPPTIIPTDPEPSSPKDTKETKTQGTETKVVVPKEEGPSTSKETTVQVEVPKTIKENPADKILAESRVRFPGVSDAVLTGKISNPEAFVDSMAFRQKLDPLMGPQVTGIGLGGETPGPGTKVALMPTSGVGGPEPNARIRQKVLAGEQLYQQIMSGNPPPATKQNVALLMWYLQALASSKAALSSGQPEGMAMFKEGALTIEDPDHRLEGFLKSLNVYSRSSSHLNEYQRIPGCEPYGLDIRGVETPNERRTLLFARLPSTTEAPDGPNLGEKKLLYLKMEPHGCRGLSFQGTGEKTGVWQGIKRFFANLKDWFGHAGGFITSQRQQGGGLAIVDQNNRERVDKALLEPYEKTINLLKGRLASLSEPGPGQNLKAAQLLTALLARLDDPGRSGKTGGIHLMVDKIDKVQELMGKIWLAFDATGPGQKFSDLPEEMIAELKELGLDELVHTEELEGLLKELDKQLGDTDRLLRSQGDHPELRFGREVILLQDEMSIGQCTPLARGAEGPLSGTGRISDQSLAETQAGYAYILSDLENQSKEYLPQFNKDVPRSTYTVAHRDYEHVEVDPQGVSEVGQAIDALAQGSGDPPEVGVALKCLAHQGLMAPLTGALSSHSLLTTGYPLSTSIFMGTTTKYNVVRVPSENHGETVYKVTGSFDSRQDGLTGVGQVPSLSEGPILSFDMAQSHIQGSMTVQVTFNRELGTFTKVECVDSSFDYKVVPTPEQPQ